MIQLIIIIAYNYNMHNIHQINGVSAVNSFDPIDLTTCKTLATHIGSLTFDEHHIIHGPHGFC